MSDTDGGLQAEAEASDEQSRRVRWVREVLNIEVEDVPEPPSRTTVGAWQDEARREAKRQQEAYLKPVRARASEVGDPPGCLPDELAAIDDARGDLDRAIAALEQGYDRPTVHKATIDQALVVLQAAARSAREAKSARVSELLEQLDAAAAMLRRTAASAEQALTEALAAWEKAHAPVGDTADEEVKTECKDALDAFKLRIEAYLASLDEQKRDFTPGVVPVQQADIAAVERDAASERDEAMAPVTLLTDRLTNEKSTLDAEPLPIYGVKITNTINRLKEREREKLKKDGNVRERRQLLQDFDVEPARLEKTLALVQQIANEWGAPPEIVRMKTSPKPSQRIGAQLVGTPAEPAWKDYVLPKLRRLTDLMSDDRIVALARAIQAIGDANDDVNEWLVELALSGVKVDRLAEFHANVLVVRALRLSDACLAEIADRMTEVALLADIGTLCGGGESNGLKQAAVAVRVRLNEMAAARKVLADECGLLAGTKPDHAAEKCLGDGIRGGYVTAQQGRTIHTSGIGNGHAYTFRYFGGPAGLWEVHVHKNTHPDSWYPEWKATNNPRAPSSPGRATYRLDPGLKSAL